MENHYLITLGVVPTNGSLMIFLTYKLESLSEEAIGLVNDHYVQSCGLNVRELRVLRCIDDSPAITPSGVVAQAYMEKSLVSRILNLLIKQGLVRRAVSADDARQFNLSITPKGRKLRAHADEVGKILEDVMLAPLSHTERQALSELLEKMSVWVKGDGMSAELAKRLKSGIDQGSIGGSSSAIKSSPARSSRS